MIAIQEGAIFVADAHYPHHNDTLRLLLEGIDKGEIKTPQLFLMGDIFDLLFGYNSLITKGNEDMINLLQKLSSNIEIHYLEGNHDFCLSEIFTNINVYPRSKQPVFGTLQGKSVGLSHGDRYESGWVYGLYSFFLRNKFTLQLLRPFEKKIIPNRIKWLCQKDICSKISNFEQKARAILSHYDDSIDLVIEGHFHQGVIIDDRYISLPSMACSDEIGIVKNGVIEFRPCTTLW